MTAFEQLLAARSAIYRGLRTILQIGTAVLTVETVESAARVLGAHFELGQAEQSLTVAVLTAVYAYLHRRFLDPSRIPSLSDPDQIVAGKS